MDSSQIHEKEEEYNKETLNTMLEVIQVECIRLVIVATLIFCIWLGGHLVYHSLKQEPFHTQEKPQEKNGEESNGRS